MDQDRNIKKTNKTNSFNKIFNFEIQFIIFYCFFFGSDKKLFGANAFF